MMKSMIFSLTILLALAVSSHGFACSHNFCDNVQCADVTEESCNGKFAPNGSTCGCCDACLTILQPGEICFSLLLSGGPASTVTCPDNYICDRTSSTCQPLAN